MRRVDNLLEQSRAEQSRAEQSRAEQSRAFKDVLFVVQLFLSISQVIMSSVREHEQVLCT